MELTQELKERYFALYWGQDVSYVDGVERALCVGTETYIYRIDYLELRPISSITEEEAIQCAQAGFNEEEIANSSKVFSALFVSLAEFVIDRFESVEETEGGYVKHTLASTDWLRSKGFAVDFMGISVDQWVEWGVVKLKK